MKNFFKREHSEHYFDSYLPTIKDEFNYQNIEQTHKQKVMSCLHAGEEQDFLAYRFDVLNEWMKVNERYQRTFIDRLDKVIDNLCLRNEFNSFEQQKVIELEEIVFAKWRNLKQLIVDFTVNKDEYVFYRYDINTFNKVDKNKSSVHLSDSFLYITTQRLVILKDLYNTSIEYKQIKNYHIAKYAITLELINGDVYELKCDNVYAVYVSLERVLKREKIIFN